MNDIVCHIFPHPHFNMKHNNYIRRKIYDCFNPIRPRPFQSFAWPGGRGSRRGSDAKNQGYHQPIDMEPFTSHYGPKSLPDTKSESGSFSIFGDMTSQNFPLRKGTGG